MRLLIALFITLIAAAPASAQFGDVTVYVEFVADPLIGAGGYNEVTVSNDGVDPVYAVVIGNDLSEVIYTSPSLAGVWSPRRGRRVDWERGDLFGAYPGYLAPVTPALDWDVLVGSSYSQVLAWQVTDTSAKISGGEALTGLRFLPGIGARAYGDPLEPVPFVAFGEDGSAVAQGQTVQFNPVSNRASNMTRIKIRFPG